MYLTEKEKGMLEGKEGKLVQKCMQILVALGEIYGAEKMLEINNVHSPGVSYRVAGDAGLDYVKEASMQGEFAVPMTLNTSGIDEYNWKEIGFPEDFSKCQIELNEAYEKMGGIPTYTCAPYLTGNVPLMGEHIAWGESSAIIFANSVLGARTNREGGPSALAAAVTGRVPAYGYHLDENRKATFLVKVNIDLSKDRDYAVLGYYVGNIVGNKVPIFENIVKRPRLESLKALGAALASSGGIALYHIEGITPEAPVKEAVLAEKYEIIEFGQEEYDSVVHKFSLKQDADLIVIGCPHCSINEMKELAEALDGKNLRTDMWVCVSGQVYSLAQRCGYVDRIKKAGTTIIMDTCPILCPTSDKGYKAVMTNSGKLAHYIRGLWDVDSALMQFEDCIAAAIKGKE
jgi:predicted aconitase